MKPALTVTSSYKKITSGALSDEVSNYEEILDAVRKQGMEGLIW
jgi:hypothetical protein